MSQRALHDLRNEGVACVRRGDLAAARNAYFHALGHTVAREEEYVQVVGEMRDVLLKLGDARAALTVDWYAGGERTQRALLDSVPPVDRARTLLAWAERQTQPGKGKEYFIKAAEEYESAGLIARAAIAREKAGDLIRARTLWSRLTQVLAGPGTDLYAAGLARFNLARTAKRTGEKAAAREATVGAVHLLEEAADRYETIGQRERAFDCYQVLIAIGRESGEFEHVLEGYVNVVRILREDHLRYYAIQSYEEALEVAEKQGETSAAATLARELAGYARKESMTSIANFGMVTQARLWQGVAEKVLARNGPGTIAENALLAAVIAYGETGQFTRVESLYGDLSKLPLAEGRLAHYARARERYKGAIDIKIEAAPLPKHLRHDAGFPEVWHVDLIEWEQDGSASEAAGDVILDPASWSESMRRRAVLVRLTGLALEEHLRKEGAPSPSTTSALAQGLCEQISQVELYALLSPLERLFKRPEADIRAVVQKTLSRFAFKRTFITVRAGLGDPEANVAEKAAESLEKLHFPHAFDPLARIYRESTKMRARVAAIRALAHIDTVEAAEMLMSVVEHDGPDERKAAVDSLQRARGTKFIDLARSRYGRLSTDAQASTAKILQARGIAAG